MLLRPCVWGQSGSLFLHFLKQRFPISIDQSFVKGLPEDRDAPVLTVCQRGNISLDGVLFLTTLGYQNARSITGGTSAWQEMGYATESS